MLQRFLKVNITLTIIIFLPIISYLSYLPLLLLSLLPSQSHNSTFLSSCARVSSRQDSRFARLAAIPFSLFFKSGYVLCVEMLLEDSPLFLFLNGESSLSPLSLRSNGLVHLGQGPVEGVKLSIKGCMGG